MKRALIPLLLTAVMAVAQQVPGQQPIWNDYDRDPIPEPKEQESGYWYDFLDGTFFQKLKPNGPKREAVNVNSAGGVPNSSWFTNRIGRRTMSVEEIRRGPNTGNGPVGDTFTVTRAKTTGITPGFWIKDAKGDTYIIKFDPLSNPEMATAAEVISTKLLHAIGYNVPENYIFHLRPGQLGIADDVKVADGGAKRTLTLSDVEEMLKKAPRLADGRYRAVASKLVPGKPKGGFGFYGRRGDDPNDIIPHEDRRDVRALRVFAAWLEHNDLREGNTLDVYVPQGYIRHYLIDFGSTLGSDTIYPNLPHVGKEHIFDFGEATKTLFTLGLYTPPGRKVRKPPFASVGNYSADDFKPRKWKSNFPLVAFEKMTDADARWAARIVASFTDEQLRAAVAAGELSDPAAAEYLFRQLAGRRDKIAREWGKIEPNTAARASTTVQ